MTRTPEAHEEATRQLDRFENDVVLKRAVSEEHVHELSRLAAGRRHGQRQLHAKTAFFDRLDLLDASHDIIENALFVNRRARQLDALLEGKRFGARLDLAGTRRDEVGRPQAFGAVQMPKANESARGSAAPAKVPRLRSTWIICACPTAESKSSSVATR